MQTPLTLDVAKTLRNGDTLHHTTEEYKRRGKTTGEAVRVKVTSVKTWQTRPNEVEVRVKYGLYEFFKLNQDGLTNWSTEPKD